MQVIHFMRFRTPYVKPFYFVGTDIDKMRQTAKYCEREADEGTEVNSEHVLALAVTPEKRATFERAVRAAKSGHTDYYLFSE